MTDQPQGTMLKIKLKRNEDGTRTLDPNDPMTPLLMAVLRGASISDLFPTDPEGDDMPTTYNTLTGNAGYQVPGTPDEDSPTQTTQSGGRDDDWYMRREALEMASARCSHTLKVDEVIAWAEAYYGFLAGNATAPEEK